MKRITWIIIVAIACLYITSCKKAFDYINQTPIGTCDACKITQFTTYIGDDTTVFVIGYDKKGNITSIVGNHWHPEYDYFIRYDKANRVSDILSVYPGNTGTIAWHTYRYFPGYIVDTFYSYEGSIYDPQPPYNAYDKKYTILKTDIYGRIISGELVIPQLNIRQKTFYNYNSFGNLIKEGTKADDKINPGRTNPLWQLMNLDYSKNNIVDDPLTQIPGVIEASRITSYNSYGLPLHYEVASGGFATEYKFGLIYTALDITYDCDLSKLKY